MLINKDFEKIRIPTYEPGKPEEMPLFFEKRANQGASSKMYPIPYTDRIGEKKIDKEYKAGILENKYIKVVTLPEIGGKIYSAIDKTNNYDFIYRNKVIKPCMIGIAGPWSSGGIEFNWPLHHRPTTFMPMDAVIEQDENSKTVWMGEVEPYNRLKGMVGVCVENDRSYIKAKIKLYNPTPKARPFLWWANLAVQIDDNFKTVFPPDVEYVSDHDRRAIVEWPIAKGRFETARPYDYGKGVDIHIHKNIYVPSSFMVLKGQSDYDYLSGYDSGRECGIVAVNNHHIAPGKKLWTWANNKFGYKWCENLTDDGSRYVELMTGCYADNQPDFSYIAPYETKTFEQYWYPIKDIGEVKNATIDCAVNLEQIENKIKIGFCASGEFKNCTVVLENKKEIVFTDIIEVSPEKSYVKLIDGKIDIGSKITLKNSNGDNLVEYEVLPRGTKEKPIPRSISSRPKDIPTVEELYLHGIHLIQYKHFTYNPSDYFLEALRRDSGDSRSNEAMGDICFEKGDYNKALFYYKAGQKRLELRNANPYNTDILYKRALTKRELGDDKGAYDDFYWALWSYSNRSASYYALAAMDCQKGENANAKEKLLKSLETNQSNLCALRMLYELTGDIKYIDTIKSKDVLFLEYDKHEGQAIDFAIELINFGMKTRAREVLQKAEKTTKVLYYLAYINKLLNCKEETNKYLIQAEKSEWRYCNFNRLFDIKVLNSANTPMSMFYLGSLYYDRDNYQKTSECLEKCISQINFAPAERGLALAYYDHLNKKEEAVVLMEKAYKLMPESGRIFYELSQIYKAENKPLEVRKALFENDIKNTFSRDDCTLEYCTLLVAEGKYEKVKDILFSHSFHTYEGGEGNLTNFHAWLMMFLGNKAFINKEYKKAFDFYESGLTFPKNYGEEKNVYVNDGKLYYHMSLCLQKMGKESTEYMENACHTLGDISVDTYYNIVAYDELGQKDKANELIKKMNNKADEQLGNSDLYPYFGVGAPAFMPFMYDIKKFNTIKALQMRGFALLAQNRTEEVKIILDQLNKLNSCDLNTIILEYLKNEKCNN